MPIDNLMHRRRLKAARAIGEALQPAENDIKTAVASTARLVLSIAQGRLEVQDDQGAIALSTAIQALAAMDHAGSLTIKSHSQLADVRDHFRMEASDVGCNLGKFSEKAATLTTQSQAA